MRQAALFLLLVLFSPVIVAAKPAYLVGMQIKPSPTYTRFIFILTKKTFGHLKCDPAHKKVTVVLTNTYKQFNIHQTKLGNANVRSIKDEKINGNDLRFVFTVKGNVHCRIHFLPNKTSTNARLQLDITSIKQQKKPDKQTKQQHKSIFEHEIIQKKLATYTKKIKSNLAKTPVATKQEKATKSQRSPAKKPVVKATKPQKFVVIIDAGHGGKDPGAIGIKGTREKKIVLSIAKRLAKRINAQPYMRAILTRRGDQFVSLRNRLKLARKGDADLFVSIHADAFYNKKARGASVYALSQRGATSEAARWLAKRENYNELDDVELNALQDRSKVLRSVLIDLSQTATIQDSLRLGNKMLDALESISSLHRKHVEQAPFAVLKSPDIPSVLVETGFITNPRDERRLATASYQQKVADALWRGINQYRKVYVLKKK